MIGVIPSITPKTAPVRIAAAQPGRLVAPLPTAAAKASVDMLIDKRAIAPGVMVRLFAGQQDMRTPPPPAKGRNALVSPGEKHFADRTTQPGRPR
ncbi:hypothetical protein GCM10011329_32050 [Stakelama pacifica]|nr:hypothetical protein GCM10011329_32050 [Stakelama pacifica]